MLKESTERVVQSLYPKALKDAEPPSVRSVTLRLIEEDGVAFTRSSEIDKDHKEIMLSTLYLEKVFESSGRNAERLVSSNDSLHAHFRCTLTHLRREKRDAKSKEFSRMSWCTSFNTTDAVQCRAESSRALRTGSGTSMD